MELNVAAIDIRTNYRLMKFVKFIVYATVYLRKRYLIGVCNQRTVSILSIFPRLTDLLNRGLSSVISIYSHRNVL